MNSIQALKELSMMIHREKHINSEWNNKIKNLTSIIEKDLERLDQLEIANAKLLLELTPSEAGELFTYGTLEKGEYLIKYNSLFGNYTIAKIVDEVKVYYQEKEIKEE